MLFAPIFIYCNSNNGRDALPPNNSTTNAQCESGRTFCNTAGENGIEDGGTAFGRGASAIDIDNDGDIDIFQTDGGSKLVTHDRRSRVYLNNGNNTFDVIDPVATWGIAEEHLFSTNEALFLDSDNDGDQDLLLVNGGYQSEPEQLAFYINDIATTGIFTESTVASGITTDLEFWWSATAADFNNDGLLDLIATCRNTDTDPTGKIENALVLYENIGNNIFTEISDEVGLPNPIGDNKNICTLDYDGNGCMDILLSRFEFNGPITPDADCGVQLFSNSECGSSYNSIELDLTVETDSVGLLAECLSFANACFDFDQDGMLDIYLGRWFLQDLILRNNGDGTFEKHGMDVGIDANLGMEPVFENTMGLAIYDIMNNDGYPEILIGTGNPFEPADPLVYCHQGASLTYERCSEDFTAGHAPTRNHGLCMADFDEDGDIEVFWNLGGMSTVPDTDFLPAYYDNQSVEMMVGDKPYPSAFVHLEGTLSNRDAIGAKITVEFTNTQGHLENRFVWKKSADGFMSQNSPWLYIALGTAQQSQANLTIEWPSGQVTEDIVIQAGDRLEIIETEILGVNDPTGNIIEFDLFPVPAKDVLHIDYQSGSEAINTIRIVSVLGQKSYGELKFEGEEEISINLQGISTGLYFLVIEMDSGKIATKPFTIHG